MRYAIPVVTALIFFKTTSISSVLAGDSMTISKERCIRSGRLTEKQCDIAAKKSRNIFYQKVKRFSSRELCERSYGRMRCSIDSSRGKIFFVPQQDAFLVRLGSKQPAEITAIIRGKPVNTYTTPLNTGLPVDAIIDLPPITPHPITAHSDDNFRCSDYVVQDPGAPADAGCLPAPMLKHGK